MAISQSKFGLLAASHGMTYSLRSANGSTSGPPLQDSCGSQSSKSTTMPSSIRAWIWHYLDDNLFSFAASADLVRFASPVWDHVRALRHHLSVLRAGHGDLFTASHSRSRRARRRPGAGQRKRPR
ncbi:1a95b422-4dc1-4a86-9963-5e7186f50c9d [Thermothielavioides terrestris]|nr:1a95b422-4dc1-4a86-9963-5e7186f50c9d [Thermothielavioides terrestris]